MDKLVEKDDPTEFHWTLDGRNTGPGGMGKRVRIRGYEEWRLDSDGQHLYCGGRKCVTF